jgi:hypothetical protein
MTEILAAVMTLVASTTPKSGFNRRALPAAANL